MAYNFKGDGNTILYSNSGSAISSGDVIALEASIAVALVDIAATTGTGAASVRGVFTLPANPDETWSQGDDLYWDSSNGYLTAESSGTIPAGKAVEAHESDEETADVSINGW